MFTYPLFLIRTVAAPRSTMAVWWSRLRGRIRVSRMSSSWLREHEIEQAKRGTDL